MGHRTQELGIEDEPLIAHDAPGRPPEVERSALVQIMASGEEAPEQMDAKENSR